MFQRRVERRHYRDTSLMAEQLRPFRFRPRLAAVSLTLAASQRRGAGLIGSCAPRFRNGSAPIPVEHAYPNGVRGPRYASPTQEGGPRASRVGLHLTKDVVQAVEKLHPVLHGCLVERREWAPGDQTSAINTAVLSAVPSPAE